MPPNGFFTADAGAAGFLAAAGLAGGFLHWNVLPQLKHLPIPLS